MDSGFNCQNKLKIIHKWSKNPASKRSNRREREKRGFHKEKKNRNKSQKIKIGKILKLNLNSRDTERSYYAWTTTCKWNNVTVWVNILCQENLKNNNNEKSWGTFSESCWAQLYLQKLVKMPSFLYSASLLL